MEIVDSQQDYIDGKVLLVDKPLEWTSFDAVKKIRYQLCKHFHIKKLKVGHAGTLDPKATGLLVICTGKATKMIDQIQAQTKTYTGTLKLGVTTPSYDTETEETLYASTNHITPADLYRVSQSFIQENQLQYPPIFSAIKKEGKRAYELAREGIAMDIPARAISIYQFEITRIQMPYVDFKVQCSKGTYIRSLAYDFGKRLDSLAYLTALRRTHIGIYDVQNAIEI